MTRPLMLDLFCGAGGCSMGYHQSGFDVVGVDIHPQPRYPFPFIQADALIFLSALIASGQVTKFDAIHASPPCQAYTTLSSLHEKEYPDLVAKTRDLLISTDKPYIIENVPGAPLRGAPLLLCGTMFGLRVLRHRYFENNVGLWMPPRQCRHIGKASGAKTRGIRKDLQNFEYLTITGHDFIVADGQEAMGIDWMGQAGLAQAIPPAYTEWIGKQLIELI